MKRKTRGGVAGRITGQGAEEERATTGGVAGVAGMGTEVIRSNCSDPES